MGSLHVQNDWATQTDSDINALSGQARGSFSFWWRPNAPVPAGAIFLRAAPSLTNLQIFCNGPTIALRAYGTSGSFELDTTLTYTVGTSYHLALSWDSAGTQVWYFNAIPQGAPVTNLGTIRTASGPVALGSTLAGVDQHISDLAFWHGHALTATEVRNLTRRNSTPGNVSPGNPPAYWWTLAGTPPRPADPTLDAGFLDQVGTGVRFTAPVGTGGAAPGGSGVYAPDALTYTSPQTVIGVNTGKDGSTLFAIPIALTAPVATPPILVKNPGNVPLTLVEPPGGAGQFQQFWAWTFSPPVLATDTLQFAAASDWSADSPPVNMPVTNYTGRVEFPIPGFPATGGAAAPTTRLGDNLEVVLAPYYIGASYNIGRNWAERILFPYVWRTDIPETNPAPIMSQVSPGQGGSWTAIWDSSDPSLDGYLTDNSGGGWTCTLAGSDPGTGGIGVSRTFSVTQGASAAAGPTLSWVWKHPARQLPYTNFWIIPPHNLLDRSNAYEIDDRYVHQLSKNGVPVPFPIRSIQGLMSLGQGANQVTPAQISPTVPVHYAPVVDHIRPVDWTRPVNIITLEGTFPLSKPMLGQQYYVAEAVCLLPHGLTTGQMVQVTPLPSISVGGGALTIPPSPGYPHVNYPCLAWVTSPTTFLYLGYYPSDASVTPPFVGIPLGQVYDIDATYDLTGMSPATAGNGMCDAYPSVRYFISLCNRLGSDLWYNVARVANDALIATDAATIDTHLRSDLKVLVEYTNETWNAGASFTPQSQYCAVMGQMMGLATFYDHNPYTVHRLKGSVAIFKQTCSPGRQVESMLMGHWTETSKSLNAARAQSFLPDRVGVAPYGQLLYDVGWTIPQTFSLLRHVYWYDTLTDGGLRNGYTEFASAMDAYASATGHRPLGHPYEGCSEIWGDLNLWDLAYHPDIYWVEMVFWTIAQETGKLEWFQHFTHLEPPLGPYAWGMYYDQSELPGYGLSNTFTGGLVVGNESPRAQAAIDWMAAVSASAPGNIVFSNIVSFLSRAVFSAVLLVTSRAVFSNVLSVNTSSWLSGRFGARPLSPVLPGWGWPLAINPERTQEIL